MVTGKNTPVGYEQARKAFLCIRVNEIEVTTHFVDLLYTLYYLWNECELDWIC
jgi:hypothetical protein